MTDKKLHKIMMVRKGVPDDDGPLYVMYDNVVSCDYCFGCLVVLKMDDGNTASFATDDWDLYDHTPQKGWNSNV